MDMVVHVLLTWMMVLSVQVACFYFSSLMEGIFPFAVWASYLRNVCWAKNLICGNFSYFIFWEFYQLAWSSVKFEALILCLVQWKHCLFKGIQRQCDVAWGFPNSSRITDQEGTCMDVDKFYYWHHFLWSFLYLFSCYVACKLFYICTQSNSKWMQVLHGLLQDSAPVNCSWTRQFASQRCCCE